MNWEKSYWKDPIGENVGKMSYSEKSCWEKSTIVGEKTCCIRGNIFNTNNNNFCFNVFSFFAGYLNIRVDNFRIAFKMGLKQTNIRYYVLYELKKSSLAIEVTRNICSVPRNEPLSFDSFDWEMFLIFPWIWKDQVCWYWASANHSWGKSYNYTRICKTIQYKSYVNYKTPSWTWKCVDGSINIWLLFSLFKELLPSWHWRVDLLQNLSWIELSPMVKSACSVIISNENDIG